MSSGFTRNKNIQALCSAIKQVIGTAHGLCSGCTTPPVLDNCEKAMRNNKCKACVSVEQIHDKYEQRRLKTTKD